MAEETTSREEQRSQYTIETGVEIPAQYASSIYPWGQLVSYDEDELASFFVPCVADAERGDETDEDAARRRRAGIQSSGRNYYDKRGIDLQAISRVDHIEGPDGTITWGVRSWALPIDVETAEEAEEAAEEDAEE